MKKIPIILIALSMVLSMAGCAIYPPYGYSPSVSIGYGYPYYGYRPYYYGNYGWGGGYGWGGWGGWHGGDRDDWGGGHHGWGGGYGWGGGHHHR